MKELFQSHLDLLLSQLSQVLNQQNVECLYIDKGQQEHYFLDDLPVPFKGNPHFHYFCPAVGEGHILELQPGLKPILHFFSPQDFWHEVSSWVDHFWSDSFEIKPFSDHDSFWRSARGHARVISPHPESAVEEGIALADQKLIDALNWSRMTKTPYEIHCLREANRLASQGHRAAQSAFHHGESEFGIMQAYLQAIECRETELPYNNIIALDEHAAILHYQNLTHRKGGSTLLIDAGAKFSNYCSDISRTYFQEQTHSLFKDLVSRVDHLQQELCLMVKPSQAYPEIHNASFLGIGSILAETSLIDPAAKDNPEVIRAFFPHGVGHSLGIQVHDVGGKQINENGQVAVASASHPFLRTQRHLRENDVVTIEPGLYFIPQLLKELSSKAQLKSMVNWDLVEKMCPLGGIRIEDNVLASPTGPVNLTREYLN